MILLTENEEKVYRVLMNHRDSMRETDKHGNVWFQVCTDQLPMPIGITRRQIAGYLSSLERKGLYRKTDKFFGMVREATVRVAGRI